MSRIYGGIHFPFDNAEGKRTGGMIADYAVANYLLPNGTLPLVRFEGVAEGIPRLPVHGQIGRAFVLEGSADLKTWQAISTNTSSIGGVLLGDTVAAGGTAVLPGARVALTCDDGGFIAEGGKTNERRRKGPPGCRREKDS
jgi:hypothetical protein